MILTIYNDIYTKLKPLLDTKKVNKIDLYSKEKHEGTILTTPYILIEFEKLNFEQLAGLKQTTETNITIHLIDKSYLDNSGSIHKEKLKEFSILEKEIFTLLHGYSNDIFGSLQRLSLEVEQKNSYINSIQIFNTFIKI